MLPFCRWIFRRGVYCPPHGKNSRLEDAADEPGGSVEMRCASHCSEWISRKSPVTQLTIITQLNDGLGLFVPIVEGATQ